MKKHESGLKRQLHFDDFNEKNLKDVKESFVMDRIFEHDFRDDIKKSVFRFFVQNIAVPATVVEGSNLPFSRAFFKFVEYTVKDNKSKTVKDNKSEFSQNKWNKIDKILDEARYSGKDLMDTELIHFATIGYCFDGKRYPVNCYVFLHEDEKEYKAIQHRISIHKGVFKVGLTSRCRKTS